MSIAPNPRTTRGRPNHRPLLDSRPFFIETKSGYLLCMEGAV